MTYVNNEIELFNALESIDPSQFVNTFIVGKEMQGPITDILVHCLNRDINGEPQYVLALRNIRINPEFQKQGIFSKIIALLEKHKQPFLIDDVVNKEVLNPFFSKRAYRQYHYEKNGETINCWLFIP